MKLYKHYKGNIYCHIADTTTTFPPSSQCPELSIHAIHSENQYLMITIVKYSGDVYFALDHEQYAVYIGADGVIWARPHGMFHGYLEDGRKRFEEI